MKRLLVLVVALVLSPLGGGALLGDQLAWNSLDVSKRAAAAISARRVLATYCSLCPSERIEIFEVGEPHIQPTDTKGLYQIVVYGQRLFESVKTLSPGEYREPIAFKPVGPKPGARREPLKLLSLDLAYTYILSEDGSLQCLGTVLKLEPEVKVERINLPTAVTAALPAGAARGVRGWHGAEWGMTTEQVTAAIGVPLGTPVKSGLADMRSSLQLDDDPEVVCYDVQTMPADEGTAKARFCFGGKGQTGLMLIDRVMKPEATFSSTRDELAAKYGEPTSSGNATFGGNKIERSRWLLLTAEIHCGSNMRSDSRVTVTYLKPRPPPA